jgi:disulfide bond formation protein DsbB
MTLKYLFDILTTFGSVALLLLAVLIYLSIYSKKTEIKKITNFFIKHSILLITTASFVAIVGSLIYSEILKFELCLLCWWQRVFIYPIFFIGLVALIKKDKNPFQYINPLIFIAFLFSLYHNYLIWVADEKEAFLCNVGSLGVCSERYVEIFSIIDIPFMALAIILFIFVLSIISLRDYKKNN